MGRNALKFGRKPDVSEEHIASVFGVLRVREARNGKK
jgi:hypothetical protein